MQGKSQKNQSAAEGAYRFGAFDLYASERRLCRQGRPVALQPKVFDALVMFVQNSERLIRRTELVETLWPDTYVTDTNLTNLIVSLRKLLGREAIQTVSKFGYRFSLPVVGEPGIDPSAYATFVRGKELAGVRSIDSMGKARDLFSLCVARDPSFAAAWAWLGRSTRFLEKFGVESSVNREIAEAALQRALAVDPNLACAHHFLTQLQADLGQARSAMLRLCQRITGRGGDAESFAGLVQVCRCCGLLDESVASHHRAVALDPTITTSVAHTHFLRCEYEASIETYRSGTRYYLDAAAWAALGETSRAATLLRERRVSPQLSALMSSLMDSLLAVLEVRKDDALLVIRSMQITSDSEVLFYLARHCGMIGAAQDVVSLVKRARLEGFSSSWTLEHDDSFSSVRNYPAFRKEMELARERERECRRLLAPHRECFATTT